MWRSVCLSWLTIGFVTEQNGETVLLEDFYFEEIMMIF